MARSTKKNPLDLLSCLGKEEDQLPASGYHVLRAAWPFSC